MGGLGGGIFSGLWGGISNTLGRGADEISERSGSADKKRAQALALTQLSIKNNEILAAAKQKQTIIIAVVVIVIIVMVLILKKRS